MAKNLNVFIQKKLFRFVTKASRKDCLHFLIGLDK
jgi:hypothetical protein